MKRPVPPLNPRMVAKQATRQRNEKVKNVVKNTAKVASSIGGGLLGHAIAGEGGVLPGATLGLMAASKLGQQWK